MDTSEATEIEAKAIEDGFGGWLLEPNIPTALVNILYKTKMTINANEGLAYVKIDIEAGKEYLMSVETAETGTGDLNSESITSIKVFKPSQYAGWGPFIPPNDWGAPGYSVGPFQEDNILDYLPFNYALNYYDDWYDPPYYYGGRKLKFTSDESGLHLFLLDYSENDFIIYGEGGIH
jgi:hypothetical protein